MTTQNGDTPNTPDPAPTLTDAELIERLAAIEHERWSDWQQWCHKVLREHCPSPELERVLMRWDRQIATPYDDLSESEKESDREQVYRYWPLIQEHVVAARPAGVTFSDDEAVAIMVALANEMARCRKIDCMSCRTAKTACDKVRAARATADAAEEGGE